MKPELPWTSLLDLLALNKTICRGILGSVVGTQGSGPFDESGFDDFLLTCGVQVRLVSGEIQPPVVIFGREFWDEEDVDTLRAQHPERHLRVYSQEMVVASMAIGGDILDHLGDEIDDFVRGHPALERFYGYMDTEVDLPAPSALSTHSQRKLLVSFDSGVWPSAGILSTMGYRVGRHGLRDAARRSILSEVMGVEIVAASPAASDYVAEWGEPASSRRLKKMANAIAAFARNARKRSGDFSEAIEAWEADLIWLQLTYG
ncbi:hypothetical protein [Mycolicibacterium llatzerense]|uniref:hypothetical protein n=1 Tax=Mycolicibacterium llatzerense TaxID=280871 RepID=UPI0013A6F1B8|nr:hypothetical protein [Mycolicibacterium llatzerense]